MILKTISLKNWLIYFERAKGTEKRSVENKHIYKIVVGFSFWLLIPYAIPKDKASKFMVKSNKIKVAIV